MFRQGLTKKQGRPIIWKQYNLCNDEETEKRWVRKDAWRALENLEYFAAELQPELMAEEETRFQWLAMEHAYVGAYAQYYSENLEQFLREDIQKCAYETR